MYFEIYGHDDNWDLGGSHRSPRLCVVKAKSKAQAEAVKEFAEKMKKQIANTMYCRDGYVDYDDTMDVIDELLKEFLEQ